MKSKSTVIKPRSLFVVHFVFFNIEAVVSIILISSLIILVSLHYFDILLDIINFSYLYLEIILRIFNIFSAICGDDLIASKENQRASMEGPRDAGCWLTIKSQSADEIIWVKLSGTKYVEVTSDSSVCLLHVISLLTFFLQLFWCR